MDVLALIVTLAVVGFLLWVVTTYVPMPPPFKQVLVVLVVLLILIWFLRIMAPGFLVFPRA